MLNSASIAPKHPFQFNVLFFGSDIFAKTVLEALYKNRQLQSKESVIQKLEAVIGADIAGKHLKRPAEVYCEEKNINFCKPLSTSTANRKSEWDTFLSEKLTKDPGQDKNRFDIGIVCTFEHMIPDRIIDYFEYGVVVIHPSLLPRYRGASPIQYALLNGDIETGITLQEISKGIFDAGNIFIQEKMPIRPTDRFQEIELGLGALGSNLIIKLLENYEYFQKNKYPQTKTPYGESSTKKLTIDAAILNWEGETNIQIYNRYRAMWKTEFDTVRTQFGSQWFLIDGMEPLNAIEEEKIAKNYPNAKPGSIWLAQDEKYKSNLYVKCKEGWIVVKEGHLETAKDQGLLQFINLNLSREKILADKLSAGSVFFKNAMTIY